MRLAGECSLTFMTLLCGAGCFSKPVFVALSSKKNKVKAMVSRNSTACIILIHWRCSCWVFVQAKYLLFVPHKNDIVRSLTQQAPSWPYLLSDHHLRLLLTELLGIRNSYFKTIQILASRRPCLHAPLTIIIKLTQNASRRSTRLATQQCAQKEPKPKCTQHSPKTRSRSSHAHWCRKSGSTTICWKCRMGEITVAPP